MQRKRSSGCMSCAIVPPSPTRRTSYAQAGRTPSSIYAPDSPSRQNSVDSARPAWRSASQSGQHGVFVPPGGRSRIPHPVAYQQNDMIAQHLLIETALLDSQDFELLAMEEVDALKKEKTSLDTRLESTRRKLALESKLRDAAQSLHRLYTPKETPTSPTSPPRNRMSFRGERRVSSNGPVQTSKAKDQAGDELAASSQKIDELLQILSGLEGRRQYVESRLLRHTAAVLQAAHRDSTTKPVLQLSIPGGAQDPSAPYTSTNFSGVERLDELFYDPKQINGHDSLVHGQNGLKGGMNSEKMAQMQGQLDTLNKQLLGMIKNARDHHSAPGSDLLQELSSVHLQDLPPDERMDEQIAVMDKSLGYLDKELTSLRSSHQRLNEDSKHQAHAIEGRLEGMNLQLFALLSAAKVPGGTTMESPPAVSGHGTQKQIEYLEDSMAGLEQAFQHQASLGEAAARANEDAGKSAQYDTILGGLWQTINANEEEPEPFSIHAFSGKVQRMHSKAGLLDEQTEILRRQIQQQRELNSKSDAEKDKQLSEVQASHSNLEQEILILHEKHAEATSQAENSRSEMDDVLAEVERLKQMSSSHAEQKQQMAREVEEHRTRVGDLEAEMVRLTTELTMAKADLDSVHGTKAERAKEQAGADSERIAKLEKELREMASEYQDIMRESVAMEKEREQLEATIDRLGERIEGLESQLSDERLRWLGIKSPTGSVNGDAAAPRETTSTAVMRNEFKKMVRETRAEGVRLLRAEQEERRRLETLIRSMRKEQLPTRNVNGLAPPTKA